MSMIVLRKDLNLVAIGSFYYDCTPMFKASISLFCVSWWFHIHFELLAHLLYIEMHINGTFKRLVNLYK